MWQYGIAWVTATTTAKRFWGRRPTRLWQCGVARVTATPATRAVDDFGVETHKVTRQATCHLEMCSKFQMHTSASSNASMRTTMGSVMPPLFSNCFSGLRSKISNALSKLDVSLITLGEERIEGFSLFRAIWSWNYTVFTQGQPAPSMSCASERH